MITANFDPDDGLPLPTMNLLGPPEQRKTKQIQNVPSCDCEDGLALPVMNWNESQPAAMQPPKNKPLQNTLAKKVCPTCKGSGSLGMGSDGLVMCSFCGGGGLVAGLVESDGNLMPAMGGAPHVVTNFDAEDELALPTMDWNNQK